MTNCCQELKKLTASSSPAMTADLYGENYKKKNKKKIKLTRKNDSDRVSPQRGSGLCEIVVCFVLSRKN